MIDCPFPPLSTRPTLSWRRLRADMRRFAQEGRLREFLASLPPTTLPLFGDDGWIERPGNHQVPPDEDAPWRTWLLLGGRGAGKTRAGAEWVRALALGRCGALVGESHADVREEMVAGESGLLAIHAPGERPQW